MKPEEFLEDKKKKRMKRIVLTTSGISVFGALLIIFKVFHFSSHFGGVDENAIQINSFRIDSVSKKMKSQFPAWLKQLYPDTIHTPHRDAIQIIENFTGINDSVSYCIYLQHDGVSDNRFLATYVNQKEKQNLHIESSPDHDLSMPHYRFKNFELLPENTFLVKDYVTSVHDSLIDERGWIKKGYDFAEAPTTTDSTLQVFQINGKGEIVRK